MDVGMYDPIEFAMMRKVMTSGTDTSGGTFVPLPGQGELIELLKPMTIFDKAGCTEVPLPPQGRIKYPRQTAASSTYWVGENAPISASDIGTGEVTLQARKLAPR